jgi:hypothetical protein
MSVVTYRIFAEKKDAQNPAKSAKKPLMPWAPKTKKSIWNCVLKVALNAAKPKGQCLRKTPMYHEGMREIFMFNNLLNQI